MNTRNFSTCEHRRFRWALFGGAVLLTLVVSDALWRQAPVSAARTSNPQAAGSSSAISQERAPISAADAGDVDPSFNASVFEPIGFSGGLARQSDGKTIVFGAFTSINGMPRDGIARLNADGSLDTSFSPSPQANGAIGQVQAVAVQPDGKIVIGGSFTSINGTARNNIARLNTDGSLDTSFNPGSGTDKLVQALAVQSDGKIVIAGFFTSVNGMGRNRIARLNTDGSLDTSFDPGSGASGTFDFMQSIALQVDGKVVIGGQFTSINGTARKNIARLNTDGSLDTSFNPGSGPNFGVNAVALQSDAKVVIGGGFSNVNGTARQGIARLNADGSLDTSFNPGSGTDFNSVSTLALQADGKIVIGGLFSSVNGVTHNSIARLNSNGSLDSSFNPSATRGGGAGGVFGVAVQPDGKIVIIGGFTNVNGTAQTAIARLNADGSLDTSFNPGSGANNSTVLAAALQTDGKIAIGARFTSVDGTGRNGIARLNVDGSLDTSFNPGSGTDVDFSGEVHAILVQPDAKIVIVGTFFSINGTTRQFIARLNADGSVDSSFNPGTALSLSKDAAVLQSDGKIVTSGQRFTGTPVIVRFNTNGSVDSSFSPTPNGSVEALAVQPDGKILIAGSFTIVNGTSRNAIARLNTDGSLDASFNPGSGATGGGFIVVGAVALQLDGKIIIGGSFTSVNGTARNRIARLNVDGSLDTSFDPGSGASATSDFLQTIVAQSDGKIVIGGQFNSFNGTARNNIARLNADGSIDTSFNPGSGTNGSVAVIRLQPDGNIVIGGAFTKVNGATHFGIARLAGAGPTPTPTPTPTPATVQFDSSNYPVNEGDGHATVTVTRTGNTSGASTVDYRTTDTDTFSVNCSDKHGNAFGRCDFATVVGTLSFAAGETSKTFAVPIIDDSYAEGTETFSVVLSNATGATLGAQSSATVTITDNETVDGPNPILAGDNAGIDFFVRQHYLDFLGREPEPGQPWSNVLRNCSNQFNTDPNNPAANCDRLTVSGDFFGSPEFKDKGIYVIDFYRVAFNRLPTYVEFSTDLASVTGATAQDTFARRAAFANTFAQRTEFTNSNFYPNTMSNSDYVNALMGGVHGQTYNLTSITTPDPANPDGNAKVTLTTTDLINGLNGSTLTRAQVLRAIVQSDQITQNLEAVNAFVASQYYGYLRRTPETAGFNNWVTYLKANPTDFRTMVNGFLNSTEYRLRFGPT